MHDEVFGFASDSWMNSVPHMALLVITTLLLIAVVIRLGVSVFATEKVKERKPKASEPIQARRWPSEAAKPQNPGKRKGQLSPELLSEAVIRYLDQAIEGNAAMEVEPLEERLARSEKDRAAQEYRAFMIKRMMEKDSDGPTLLQ
jgi:hypothetical protein